MTRILKYPKALTHFEGQFNLKRGLHQWGKPFYKEFKKTGVRFNARRAKLKLTLNKLNLRLWNNLEFKRLHKKSRHPKFNDTLWKLKFKHKQEIKAFYGGISESTYKKLNKKIKLNNNSPACAENLFNSQQNIALTQTTPNNIVSRKSSNQLLNVLETRLDVIVFKLNWAMSIYHAKQLISHGHIQVNGKKVKIPSYILRPNDTIQVSSNPQSRKLIKGFVIKKLSRINSIIELIYFKRLPYYLGGITNLKNKFESWLFLPLSLEVDYLTMTATLIFNNPSSPIIFPYNN